MSIQGLALAGAAIKPHLWHGRGQPFALRPRFNRSGGSSWCVSPRPARFSAMISPRRAPWRAVPAARHWPCRIAPPPEVLKAVSDGADLHLPLAERREAVAKAHFAPGHDPGPWIDGWYPAVGMAQQASVTRDSPARWWNAGGRSILVIQPRQDAAAPSENAELLKRENPARVDLVYLENSGHAAFPEQPDELERLITMRVKPNRRCEN